MNEQDSSNIQSSFESEERVVHGISNSPNDLETNNVAYYSSTNISTISPHSERPYDYLKRTLDEEEIRFKIDNINEKNIGSSRSSSISNEEHIKKGLCIDPKKYGLRITENLPEIIQSLKRKENESLCKIENSSLNNSRLKEKVLESSNLSKSSKASYLTPEWMSSSFNRITNSKDTKINKLLGNKQKQYFVERNIDCYPEKTNATTSKCQSLDNQITIPNEVNTISHGKLKKIEFKSKERDVPSLSGYSKPEVFRGQSAKNKYVTSLKHFQDSFVPHSTLNKHNNKRGNALCNTFPKSVNNFGNKSKDQDRKLLQTDNEFSGTSHLKKFNDMMDKSNKSKSLANKKDNSIIKKQSYDNLTCIDADAKQISPYNPRKTIDLKATSKSKIDIPSELILKSNYFPHPAKQNYEILTHNKKNVFNLNSAPNNYLDIQNISSINNFDTKLDRKIPSKQTSVYLTSSINYNKSFENRFEPLKSNLAPMKQSSSNKNKGNNELQNIQSTEGTPINYKSNRKLSESFLNKTVASIEHIDISSKLEKPCKSTASTSRLTILNKDKNNKNKTWQHSLVEKSMNVAKTDPSEKIISNFITPMTELDFTSPNYTKTMNKEVFTPESKFYNKTKALNNRINGLKTTQNHETIKNKPIQDNKLDLSISTDDLSKDKHFKIFKK